jgi:diguanylate cyclase (GGDEF)-like protein/PAS domain S-box-containing protein
MQTSLFDNAPPSHQVAAWRLYLGHLHLRHWLTSLQGRMVAGALLALVIGMSLTAWQMGQVAQAQLLARAQERELAEVRHMASIIGHRVSEMQRALRVVGEQLDPATLNDPKRLANFFASQPLLRSLYASVFAAGTDGQVQLVADGADSRFMSTSVADRDYFQRALATRQPVISDPIEARVANEPVVIFAQPLSDDHGVWGVLAGSLRLASRDLIEEMTHSPADTSSELSLVSDSAGRVLAHPHRSRLLAPLKDEVRLGEYLSTLQREGYDIDGQTAAWTGQYDVIAVAVEPTTRWQVWQVVSRDAVLQPMRQARTGALQSALVYAIVLAGCLSLFLAWQLRPLKRLEERAASLMAGDEDQDWPVADGEIGKLTRTLRHVWAERAQVERFNAEVLQKLGSVMSAAPVGLAFTRHQRFELVSAEFCRLVGRCETDLLGHRTQLIYASNENYLAIGPKVGAAFAAHEAYVGDWQLLRGDGGVFWARLHARAVDLNDASAGTIWSVYDITEQIDTRALLEHAAAHDPLTGVQNRKGFERAIAAVFDQASQGRQAAALLMIDLDDFKPVNDSAGHAAGDAVLKAVAQSLLGQVRASDTVARLGGDEFAVLLPGCEQDRARTIADKVLAAVSAIALPWETRMLRVGASIGVATLSNSHVEASQWVAEADAACYAAKRAGRGTVRLSQAVGSLTLVVPPTGTRG